MSALKHTAEVLAEVLAERARQEKKWGEQNHPDLNPLMTKLNYDAQSHAGDLEIPTGNRGKFICQNAFANGQGSYSVIALEEFCEAIEAAALGKREELREELIQCAAVFVAWVEKLDRDVAKKAEVRP